MSEVLIIDDDINVCDYVTKLLQKKIDGLNVISAHTGVVGIKEARRNLPDTILLDIVLPDMNGLEVCRELKNDTRTKEIPIIIETGNSDESNSKINALNAGADAFVEKPFDSNELVAQVKVALRIKHVEDELRSQKENLEREIFKRTCDIRKRDQRFLDIFNNVSDFLYFHDLDGNFKFDECNFIVKEKWRWIEKSSGSRNVRDIMPERLREQFPGYLCRVKENGSDNGLMVVLMNDGEEHVVEYRNSLVVEDGKPVGVRGSARDITDRINAERALKKSEARYRNIIESIEEGYYEMDMDGRFTYINDSICRILGATPEEIQGRCYREYVEKDSALHIQQSLTGINIKGESFARVEFEVTRKDGSRAEVEASISQVKSKGEIIGIRGVVRDVTERKDAEERLIDAQNQLESTNLELLGAYAELKSTQSKMLQSEKMASIGQLAAGVAHEINNPVGFVTSNLGTLKKYIHKIIEYDSFVSEKIASIDHPDVLEQIEQEKNASKIRYIIEDMGELIDESLEGTARVKKIVQDLKSFSRVDEDQFKPANINECIESTLNIVWNELKYKVDVHKDYGDIPMTMCYPQQLNQIFMNLLINAGQAIEERGEISIRTWCEDHSIRISIMDTGCGIPEDKLSRIFEPFFTTKEVGRGTGLGLSIVYDIVQKHKGEIEAKSEVGKGTTFDVSIPVILENSK